MPDECANPLLLQWLQEWMDQARERNSKGFTLYKKAHQSMKVCPIAFSHPSEAQILNGIGPKLCDRLADKLQEHCKENGLPMPEKKKVNKRAQATNDETEATRPEKKPRKTQSYVPKLRSGPYALILALATLDEEGSQALSKNDLIEIAQPHCDTSFNTPSDPTKFFTAWNSIKTLESKELVCTKGHPTKRYYLSDEGWEVANSMKKANGDNGCPAKQKGTAIVKAKGNDDKRATGTQAKQMAFRRQPELSRPDLTRDMDAIDALDIVDLSSNPEISDDNHFAENRQQTNTAIASDLRSLSTQSETILLPPETFEIRLVLDTREIRSTTDRDYISNELKKHEVAPVMRSLPLGDVLWVAQIKDEYVPHFLAQNPGDEEAFNTEIVLDHIMERKRLDDLIGSIKDGRFNEQKFRLKKSGIKHVTYLIEDYSISAERSEKYGEAVESVIASMQVVNDIFVKQTSKLDNTIRYLARMTKTLQNLYREKEIRVVRSARLEAASYLNLVEQLRKDSRDPDVTFGTTFSTFAAMCDKSDSMTLRDVYLKMLLCIRGVTPNNAVEIQKLWPTPRAFVEAFEATSKGKENMVSDRLGDNIPRKKVGKALGAKIAEVWS